MPSAATVRVLPSETLGRVHPFIYGHFIEHLGRCIYGGVWAAERHETNRVAGYREDVLEAVKSLRVPVLRYPGGCFADGYHWKDGIGPRDKRPTVFDPAWKSDEPNAFGTDEFLRYCELLGATPYLNANFGSGSVGEAVEWLRYCHDSPDTHWGGLRAANGRAKPYRVPIWGIGNEVCGSWEIGHTDAESYGRGFIEYAEAMKAVDPSIRLVAVGWDETIPDWSPQVVEVAGEHIDYLSLHHYVPGGEMKPMPGAEDLYYAIVASPLSTERKLRWLRQVIEDNLRVPRRIEIALDEWNVWLPSGGDLTQEYKLRDGLYAAGIFHALHRQCASVTMANLAQLVNVLGAIRTDERRIILTPIYWAFRLYGPRTGEVALRTEVEADAYEPKPVGNITGLGAVPYLDVSATFSEERATLFLAVVNRHWEEPIAAGLDIAPLVAKAEARVAELNGPSPLAENNFEAPNAVGLSETTFLVEGSCFEYGFPPHSATVLSIPV